MKYEDTEGFINYHKDNLHYPIILSVDDGSEWWEYKTTPDIEELIKEYGLD